MASCYRPSSMAHQLVGRSVGHTSEPCKNGKPIEMPFGLRTQVGPGNYVLDGGSRSPNDKGQFWGKGSPIVEYRDFLP